MRIATSTGLAKIQISTRGPGLAFASSLARTILFSIPVLESRLYSFWTIAKLA